MPEIVKRWIYRRQHARIFSRLRYLWTYEWVMGAEDARACRARRAAEAGVSPIEQRLWEAGFSREGAARAAETEVIHADRKD